MSRVLLLPFVLLLTARPVFAQLLAPPPLPPPPYLAAYARGERYTYGIDAPGHGIAYSTDLFRTSQINQEVRVTDDGDSYLPALSPDGAKLAFLHPADAKCNGCIYRPWSIVISNADGTIPRTIAELPSVSVSMFWSPDSKSLAYMIAPFDLQWPSKLYVVRPDSGNPPLLIGPAMLSEIAWSPDSQWIAYLCPSAQKWHQPRLCVARPSDPRSARILSALSIGRYAWSSDSSRLAFSGGPKKISNLYVVSLDDAPPVSISALKYKDPSIDWSADSNEILFTDVVGHGTAVFKIKPDGSSRQRLTDPKILALHSFWACDSGKITFSAMAHRRRQVFVMNSDGSNLSAIDTSKFRQCLPVASLQGTNFLFLVCGRRKYLSGFEDLIATDGRTLFLADLSSPGAPAVRLADRIYGDVSVVGPAQQQSRTSADLFPSDH